MRLSAYLRTAISLKDVKQKYPAQANRLDLALKQGIQNKWLLWLALKSKDNPELDLGYLVSLAKKLDELIASKKIDGLILKKLADPRAKDTGYWQNRPIDELDKLVNQVPAPSLSSTQTESKVAGARKIFDDGTIAAWHVDTFEAMKQLGKDTKWCVTVKSTWDDYVEDEVDFVVLWDRSRLDQPRGKIALAFRSADIVDGYDAADKSVSEAKVALWYKPWPAIKSSIKLKKKQDPLVKMFGKTVSGATKIFDDGRTAVWKVNSRQGLKTLAEDDVELYKINQDTFVIWDRKYILQDDYYKRTACLTYGPETKVYVGEGVYFGSDGSFEKILLKLYPAWPNIKAKIETLITQDPTERVLRLIGTKTRGSWTVKREAGDFWQGDKVKIECNLLLKSKVRGWVEGTTNLKLRQLRNQELAKCLLVDGISAIRDLDLSSLVVHLSKAIGLATPKGVKWQDTGNKVTDRFLQKYYTYDSYLKAPWEADPVDGLTVVEPIDPVKSLRLYGYKCQPHLADMNLDG